MLALGGHLQQVVPQGLVLPGLDLTRVLELLLDLELFGLGEEPHTATGQMRGRKLPFVFKRLHYPKRLIVPNVGSLGKRLHT